MANPISREVRLASHPRGLPTIDNFILAQVELPALQDDQVLVRNRFMSVDPYMRGRMNPGKSYAPPFEIGQPLSGGAAGEVVESRSEAFKPGMLSLHFMDGGNTLLLLQLNCIRSTAVSNHFLFTLVFLV